MAENTGERTTPEPYTVLKDPEQREVIKRRAIDLANTAAGKQTVVFLDNTARPLAYLLNIVYPIVHPDKKLPDFKFLNIGSEKTDFPPFESLDELKHSFGSENVDTLQKILHSDASEERLIVDEVSMTGKTKALTDKILRIADPKNKYSFFMFLESYKDQTPFMEIIRQPNASLATITFGGAHMPWSGSSTLNSDEADDSLFTLSGTPNRRGHDTIKILHNEFKLLAAEINAEKQ